MKNTSILFLRRFLYLLLMGLFFPNALIAQEIAVRGNVTDSDNIPVIGANIVVKGSTIGTITDVDGNFTISAPQGATLVISFIGYSPVELKAAPNLRVVLLEDAIMLEEAVVIGYGTMRKSDLSGSVVAIEAEELNRGAITSPQEMIQGKVPGLYVQPGDGQPGSGSTIRIRSGASLNASNDPLIVIDGIPVSNDAAPGSPNALATINPNDIETFTVLKDASATAIFGSRASNGVIIITTKKGAQKGVKIDYTSTYSFSDPYKKVNMLNADEFRNVVNQYYPAGTVTNDRAHALLNQYPGQSTNWQDEIFRVGFSTDHNIGIAGKVSVLPYRVSFGYTNNNGTLKTSNYERYTGSVSLNPKFFDNHLSVDINVKGTINNNKFADTGAVNAAAFFDPTKPVYNEDGAFNGYWNVTNANGVPSTLAPTNPLSLLYDNDNQGTTKRSLGNLQLDYRIHGFEDLRANLNLGYDVATGKGDNYVKLQSFQAAKDSDFPNVGRGTDWSHLRRNHLLDFYLNYVKEVASIESRFDVTAGYSWQHFYNSSHDIQKSNPIEAGSKDGWVYNTAEGRYIIEGHHAYPAENYLISFFGRLNYNLKQRYLLTATLRRDGSSRFSKDNRWGLFPSAAVAWSVINEPFMENITDVLSNFKLRVGYGVTGQQEIGDYGYFPTYIFGTNPTTTYLGHYLLKPDRYSPGLKWEETATTNLAIDYGFINNRINGSIEYYIKHTKDLLNEMDAAAGTNFVNKVFANVGKIKNYGVEFNINAIAIDRKDLKWDVGYNFTWNKSTITQLTANYNPDFDGVASGWLSMGGTSVVLQKHMVDYAPHTYWLYQQVYDEDGKPIQNAFVDRNGDGQITDEDRYLTGKSSLPDFFMGFNSLLTYKNWDFGFNLRASIGNYIYNGFAANNSNPLVFRDQGFITNIYEGALKTGFTMDNEAPQRASDYFLENASFLRMDNITLGYHFDKLFTSKLSGRISVAVQNVFTITKYSGLDPETGALDYNIWPRPRTYTIGLNLNF